ncbi:Fis family transcriptional regulator [Sporomusaceae bacterium FL31]|nr:Fis family transcriptional regulator [Sporomusaceae bacterium FL31]GCE32444.1 Fis family transcriptional regulator [Sporomusaceae bacterium]
MKPLSILLVEDEVLIRVDMKEMLERACHVVAAECGNGKRAVELARQVAPELVILDIMMPGMDGLEVAKCMHELNVPVVIVTAYGQPNFVKRAENVHVYGYVVKPLSEQNLLAAVQIAYGRWQEFCQVNQELKEIKEQLVSQKNIARARAIIQDRLGLSAQEAHKRLLREAMRNQVSVADIAGKIIKKTNKVK